MNAPRNPSVGHRYPPEIIAQAVWRYHRFFLSFRDVEDLLAERGVILSYETIRQSASGVSSPAGYSPEVFDATRGMPTAIHQIGMLRAMWRALETGPRITLAGHEGARPRIQRRVVLTGYRAGSRPYHVA